MRTTSRHYFFVCLITFDQDPWCSIPKLPEFRNAPKTLQLHLLTAMYKIRSLATIKEDFTNNLALKLVTTMEHATPQIQQLFQRDLNLFSARYRFNALKRAIRRPLSQAEQRLEDKVWPVAVQLNSKYAVERMTVIQLHLGKFPILSPSLPISKNNGDSVEYCTRNIGDG